MKNKTFFKEIKRQQLEIINISSNPLWIEQFIQWAAIPSVGMIDLTDSEETFIRNNSDQCYMVFYGHEKLKTAIGMFALFDFDMDKEIQENSVKHSSPTAKEFDYFYIIPALREQGIGSIIFEQAKKIAQSQKVELLILHTLSPSINYFYIKNGVRFVCDARYKNLDEEAYATSVMKISL